MVIYAIIMLIAAAIFGAVAVLIYKGRTDLIHDYHQTKVKDKTSYGKAFGKAFGIFAGGMMLSGVIALLGEIAAQIAVAVLLVSLAAGMIAIVRVQKKYNGVVF